MKQFDKLENHCPDNLLVNNAKDDYGTITHVTYSSKTCNRTRGFNILLPAGYDGSESYPVMYMLHGIFGNEYSFTGDGNLHIKELIGNMTNQNLCKKMIVVFPDMFAASDPKAKPGFNDEAVANYDNFINDLVNDLMPFVEKNFSVKTGRENTAICGFSMGGRETLFISIMRSDLFAYAGAIAPAPGLVPARDWAMQHKGQLKEEELKYSNTQNIWLMVCCGTNDGTVGKFPLTYHQLLEKNGVEHTWYEVSGADHNNVAIQSGIYHFVQFIFQ